MNKTGAMRRGFADTSFGQIHYRQMGQGEPLILLHQTADSGAMFNPVIPALARRFRVLAPDTPGFGDSDAPAAAPLIEDYARAVVEFMDAMDIPRAHLLGHHTGATIAVEVAATWPQRVTRLVLAGCPDFPADARETILAGLAPADIDLGGRHLARAWQRIVGRLAAFATPEQMHQSTVDTLKASPNYHWAYRALYLSDVRARIAKVTAPTLLFYGEKEGYAALQEQLRPLFADARSHAAKGVGSTTMLEAPAEFAAVIGDFLAAR